MSSRSTSVVIATHSPERTESLNKAVTSALIQAPAQVIVSVDQDADLAAQVAARFPDVRVVLNDSDRGAAATRNRGVAAATTPYIAFLDDDAVADAGWLDALVAPLESPSVVGVGGHVAPLWEEESAEWFPEEFYWAIGATYKGMRGDPGPVRNVWSENMIVRRDQFLAVGGFRSGYGKTGNVSAPEDTDLCLRLADSVPGSSWMYEPAAKVAHLVPKDRASLRFLLRRSFNEGKAKTEMMRMHAVEGGSGANLSDEKRHALATVPRGIAQQAWSGIRFGDRLAARRARAGALALAAAAVGYGVGHIRAAASGAVNSRSAARATGTVPRPATMQAVAAQQAAIGPVSGLAARQQLTTTGTPWLCLEADAASGFPSLPVAPGEEIPGGAHILVRVHGEPVGSVWVATGGRAVDSDEITEFIEAELGAEIRSRLEGSTWRDEQDRVRHDGPELTAVVCTRNRAEGLRTTIESLQKQDYDRIRILVVDNASDDDEALRVVSEFADARIPVSMVVEPVPGLSRARNRAIDETQTDLIAFIDDDETPSQDWAVEIVRGFEAAENVDCVTGVIVPRSLETHTEQLFELWGGHSKGLTFVQQVHDGRAMDRSRILFPLPPFGVGGNMAFRTDALRRLGGFNTLLGAGTPVKGAEDTDMFTRVLLDGGTLVYRPSAIVGHLHRDGIAALTDQLYGYGSGLTAWYVTLLLRNPALAADLLALTPRAVCELTSSSGHRAASHGTVFPSSMRSANLRGMIAGPINLLHARQCERRLRK